MPHQAPQQSAQQCSATLVDNSTDRCNFGTSFGCVQGQPKIWVSHLCWGRFTCNGKLSFMCGYPPRQGRHTCNCTGDSHSCPRVEAAPPQLSRSFKSASDLGEWSPYFAFVYGLDTLQYPLHLSALNFFYRKMLPNRVRNSLEIMDAGSPCPLESGDLFVYNDYFVRGGSSHPFTVHTNHHKFLVAYAAPLPPRGFWAESRLGVSQLRFCVPVCRSGRPTTSTAAPPPRAGTVEN